MFSHFKNIDNAFRYVRLFSFILIAACMVICCFTVAESYKMVSRSQERIYILANGKAMEAISQERKQNIPVEGRDHVKMFHYYFFSLDPDDKAIENNLSRALYLADRSAKQQYDGLVENGYYNNIISSNISQQVTDDSVSVNTDSYPYYFRYYGRQTIIRPSTITQRTLITEGHLRNTSRTDNNPHGFLIERWKVLENRDISVENR